MMADTAASNEPNGNGNGRVTLRDLYDLQQRNNDRMAEMERRIMARIDEVTRIEPPRLVQQVNTLERRMEAELTCKQAGIDDAQEKITALQIQAARNDKITGIVAAGISSAIAAAMTWLSNR